MNSVERFSWIRNGLKKVWFQLLVLVVLLSGHLYLHFEPESRSELAYRRILTFLSVWVVAWIASRALELVNQSAWVSSKLAPHFRPLVFIFFRVVIYVTAFLVALDSLGVSVTPLVASLGVGSIAVGLALQDTLGNLFSGFYLYLDRPIAIGDWIQLDTGVEGQVVRIGWRSTHLLVGGINHLVIPNSKLSSSPITNFNLPHSEFSVVVSTGVAYDTDLNQVEEVAIQAARHVAETVPGGVPEFVPLVRMKRFGDSSIELDVIIRVKNYEFKFEAQHRLVKALKEAFDKADIEIPFPQRVFRMLPPGPPPSTS